MLHEISTVEDVEEFIEQIADEVENFHPLEEFSNYVYPESHHRRYSDEEAELRSRRLEQCFNVCSKITTDFFTYLLWKYQVAKKMLPRTVTDY